MEEQVYLKYGAKVSVNYPSDIRVLSPDCPQKYPKQQLRQS